LTIPPSSGTGRERPGGSSFAEEERPECSVTSRHQTPYHLYTKKNMILPNGAQSPSADTTPAGRVDRRDDDRGSGRPPDELDRPIGEDVIGAAGVERFYLDLAAPAGGLCRADLAHHEGQDDL
jgi:hypothetical protein